MPAAANSGADWDVHWATLLFRVGGSAATSTQPAASGDSAEVARTVGRFHAALARGDSAAALALLAPGATILESGSVETVAEYRAHHLPSDIDFARAVPATRGPVRVAVRGAAAWAASTSESKGEFRGLGALGRRLVGGPHAHGRRLAHQRDPLVLAAPHVLSDRGPRPSSAGVVR